jgi:hypothetical protein
MLRHFDQQSVKGLQSRAKNALFEPFVYLKTIILPRQARDKHTVGKLRKKGGVFFAPAMPG